MKKIPIEKILSIDELKKIAKIGEVIFNEQFKCNGD